MWMFALISKLSSTSMSKEKKTNQTKYSTAQPCKMQKL